MHVPSGRAKGGGGVGGAGVRFCLQVIKTTMLSNTPVQRHRKFSAVLGTLSAYSCIEGHVDQVLTSHRPGIA